MMPTRWSSAIAILRRRLAIEQEERNLLNERRMHEQDDNTMPVATIGDERDEDGADAPFIVRWYLPKRPRG